MVFIIFTSSSRDRFDDLLSDTYRYSSVRFHLSSIRGGLGHRNRFW